MAIINGTSGNDSLLGTAEYDQIYGFAGDDTLNGGTGYDFLEGGLGNDTYIVDDPGDFASEIAGGGNDSYQSNATSFQMDANVENLYMMTGAINATGNNTGSYIIGNEANNTITGGTGYDQLFGGNGNDLLLGEAGNDLLYDSFGDDTLTGGVGNDTYHIGVYGESSIRDLIVENINEGTDTVEAYVDYTLDANLENLNLRGTANVGTGNSLNNIMTGNSDGGNRLYGGVGDDQLFGGGEFDELFGEEGNNLIMGGSGRDGLYAYDGNDTLDGGTGVDEMFGNGGNDLYFVDDPLDYIYDFSETGIDTVNSSVSYTLGGKLENLTLTGFSAINGTGNVLNNSIIGNDANNTIVGNAGNDQLKGGNGNDILKGGSNSLTTNTGEDFLDDGSGNDTMYGQDGDDTYYVDNSFDSVIEEINGGYYDSVYSSISYTLGANLEYLGLKGTSAINGTGNSEENTIDGNNNNNSLFGEAARDYLFGLAGNDILKGGDANDLLLGGTGNDTLDGGSGYDEMEGEDGNDLYIVDNPLDLPYEIISTTGIDTVQSSVSFSLANENNTLEKLILTGTSALNGTGNTLGNTLTGNTANNSLDGIAGNDTLLGGGGIDTLIGGIGDDSLTGGAGADRLTGGTGKDRFVFTAKTEGKDTITDFSLIDDTINVSKLGFGGGLTANAAITAAQFRLGSAAGDSSDRFIYNKTSGALLFDADGTGASAQVQFAQLSTGLAMTNNDIFVIA